jgi:hypothetical protein
MKLIIAGSRSLEATVHEPNLVLDIIINAEFHDPFPTEIISGGCPTGPDRWGELWAELKNIRCKRVPADWDRYGKVAGHWRNYHMAQMADAALVLWDGVSKGSKNMIMHMNDFKKPCIVRQLNRAAYTSTNESLSTFLE